MWVISRVRLRRFSERPGMRDSWKPLNAWFKSARNADWKSFADIKKAYGSVDFVGDCVVFDIGGNKYRLVVRCNFPSHKVYVREVMTHKEYDTKDWVKSCGCHAPKAKPAAAAKPRRKK